MTTIQNPKNILFVKLGEKGFSKKEGNKMKKKELEKFKVLTNKILESSRDFMQTCNMNFDRGIIGELLTFSQLISTYKNELTACEENCIKYYGSSKKEYDFKLSLNGCYIKINSKGTTTHEKGYPKWVRQHARKFCTISYDANNKQIISPNTKYDGDLFYVYVDAKKWCESSNADADFFVLSDEEAKKKFEPKYKIAHENKRNNQSDDMWVEYNDIKEYKDNDLTRFKKCSANKFIITDIATSPRKTG